jgi:hypothetical protein
MDRSEIEGVLATSEDRITAGDDIDLRGTGFWRAVAAVKRTPELAAEFADRIAAIDRAAFERWALLTLPVGVGTVLAVVATFVGLGLITAGYYVDEPLDGLLLLAGTGVLLVSTHGVGHLVVGARYGMRFTHWFVGTVTRPQPGVKLDYASYLRTPARGRALMHASGAVVTKAIPFLMLGAAWGMRAPWWAWVALVVNGVATVVTDVLWSTGSSDWKKYAREMRYVD